MSRQRSREQLKRTVPATDNVRYRRGDYVRVEILAAISRAPISVWMRVDSCDDRHSIVYGTIDDQSSTGLGTALASGAKLGATYRQVKERRYLARCA